MADALYIGSQFIGYYPPTYASEILTSDDSTVQEKIDEIVDISNLSLTSTSATLGGQHFISNGIAYLQGYLTMSSNVASGNKIGEFNVSAGDLSTSMNWVGLINRSGNLINAVGYVYGKSLYTQTALQSGDELILNVAFKTY